MKWDAKLGILFHLGNCVSEFLGHILGRYEAKEEGFAPPLGGATLHRMMIPHEPNSNCFEDWTHLRLGPIRVADGTQRRAGPNVIKLFTAVSYEFSQ
jgi:homogentisate 1,2-dioxygenase